MTDANPTFTASPRRPAAALVRYPDEQPDPYRSWWLTLDLTTGVLTTAPDDSPGVPWAVAACWSLRWAIAPLPVDLTRKLLDEIAPTASQLLTSVSTGVAGGRDPGTLLHHGAGAALDAIARLCSATWTDPDRVKAAHHADPGQ